MPTIQEPFWPLSPGHQLRLRQSECNWTHRRHGKNLKLSRLILVGHINEVNWPFSRSYWVFGYSIRCFLLSCPLKGSLVALNCEQNEDDDLLERVPTSEVVGRLISTYQRSEVAMWASSKVHESSNRVSTSTLFVSRSFVTFCKYNNPFGHQMARRAKTDLSVPR